MANLSADERGQHLFGGGYGGTRRKRILSRGRVQGGESLLEHLNHIFRTFPTKDEPVYFEIWSDGGPPRRRAKP